MSTFKKIFFCIGLFFYCALKADDKLDSLEQKVRYLEALIMVISQNMALQQELIQLLQKQLQANIAIEKSSDEFSTENHDDEIDSDEDEDHHLLLRIPKKLLAKIDVKRKLRIGRISRNLWIIETLDEATRK